MARASERQKRGVSKSGASVCQSVFPHRYTPLFGSVRQQSLSVCVCVRAPSPPRRLIVCIMIVIIRRGECAQSRHTRTHARTQTCHNRTAPHLKKGSNFSRAIRLCPGVLFAGVPDRVQFAQKPVIYGAAAPLQMRHQLPPWSAAAAFSVRSSACPSMRINWFVTIHN